MSFNWNIVTDKLYGIIKGSCKKLVMYDAKGNETIDPEKATRFFATFSSDDPALEDFTILVAIHDQGQSSFINIKTPNLKEDVDFKKVNQVRNHIRRAVGQREGIKVVWQVFDHEIDPREEAVHNIKESKDIGKWFGTTKSSFQRIGEAKLIIRHSDVVDDATPGARTRHIRALFVENKQGERFAYPQLHMSGARAFARHISNGGTNYDSIAESIMNLSSDYISLRRASLIMRKNQIVSESIVAIRENMNDINRRLKSLHGPKGYARAESILATKAIILDETATQTLWVKLAEECSCDKDHPFYGDLGVAAKYLGQVDNQPQQISFSWNRQPNIADVPDDREVLERLHWQISELADACADSHAAARLREIAEMIADNAKPTKEDIDLVREAVASSLTYAETTIPEQAELDEFLNEFVPENIFAEDLELVENYNLDDDDQMDEGFFVVIGNEEDGVFVGMVNQDGGKWRESTIAGTPPANWGHGYMSYLTPQEVMAGIKKDYGTYNQVAGPFTDEHEAMRHAHDLGLEGGNDHYDDYNDVVEGYHIMRPIDTDRYQQRAGLEGPFMTRIGKVVYYDPKEGKYYDPDSDFYIDYQDYAAMNSDGVKEGDAYGIAQKARERRQEIAYNKKQRAKRWNFGNPLPDDTSADSDLEETNSQPCLACGGTGQEYGETCVSCGGTGDDIHDPTYQNNAEDLDETLLLRIKRLAGM